MKTPPGESCSECRFWKPDEKTARRKRDKGCCRLLPPVVNPERPKFSLYPVCFGDDWCGEFVKGSANQRS